MKHLLFTLFVFLGFAAQCQTDTSAQLKFDTTVWDFGNIPVNIPVKHTFYIKNTRQQPLIIQRAAGSGGGAVPEINKDLAYFGDSGEVTIWKHSDYPGSFAKVINVYTNQGVFQLTVKGQVLNGPKITFEKTEHDFGDIPQNNPSKAEFIYTNTGDMPLIVTNVASSWGCMVPEYSKEPVMPGQTGLVKLIFNTATIGTFTKSAYVTSNGGELGLLVKGKIIEKPR